MVKKQAIRIAALKAYEYRVDHLVGYDEKQGWVVRKLRDKARGLKNVKHISAKGKCWRDMKQYFI